MAYLAWHIGRDASGGRDFFESDVGCGWRDGLGLGGGWCGGYAFFCGDLYV